MAERPGLDRPELRRSGAADLLARLDSLAKPQEFLAQSFASQLRMKDGGGVNEAHRRFRAPSSIGRDREAVPGFKPGERTGFEGTRSESLDVFGEGIGLDAHVDLGQVAEQVVARSR
jgi:hypothetical protein